MSESSRISWPREKIVTTKPILQDAVVRASDHMSDVAITMGSAGIFFSFAGEADQACVLGVASERKPDF